MGTYDGPVPIPGTLKSRLAPYYVRTTMGYALRLWFHKRQYRFMGKYKY